MILIAHCADVVVVKQRASTNLSIIYSTRTRATDTYSWCALAQQVRGVRARARRQSRDKDKRTSHGQSNCQQKVKKNKRTKTKRKQVNKNNYRKTTGNVREQILRMHSGYNPVRKCKWAIPTLSDIKSVTCRARRSR